MPAEQHIFIRKRYLPAFIIAAILVSIALLLHLEGRLWICACGRIFLWAGNVCSSDNSQHLFDPYTFTHILHGFAFCGLLALVVPRLPLSWKLCLAILLEACWELLENSDYIIRRFREETAALGYQGDTVVNSFGDITACAIGFILARKLGLWRSLIIFIATETILTIWIKDSLLLEIIMLIHPIDALKTWQMCH
jgi:hypothetical protein